MRPGDPSRGHSRFLGPYRALHQESGQLWSQDSPEHERVESALQDGHRGSDHFGILGSSNSPLSERSSADMGG